MKRFLTDKVAIISALVGVVLMITTVAWNANPVEESVMPGFLTGNYLGWAVVCILIATSVPTWIATYPFFMLFQMFGGAPDWLLKVTMVLLQGVIYFMIGKVISLCVTRFSKRKDPSSIDG